MAAQSRISSPEDQEGITCLMKTAFGLPDGAAAIDPQFQHWKYWAEHPLAGYGRSYVLNGHEKIVAHGCRWPMRIVTTSGEYDAFHLIDWAADSSYAGAGLKVLRESCDNAAALFSIGGSHMTRKILPALGELLRRRTGRTEPLSYHVAGQVYFLDRPLQPIAAALHDSPLDWKTPARIARNLHLSSTPAMRLPNEYSFSQVSPEEMPPHLWPRPTSDFAVTLRTGELLKHFEHCPILQQPMCFFLSRQQTPVAYFFLAQVGNHVRLADYGPAGMDEAAGEIMGLAAQIAAKQYFPHATRISAATSESPVRDGLVRAGLRNSYDEEIRALVVEEALNPVSHYRLTYLDCDALCL